MVKFFVALSIALASAIGLAGCGGNPTGKGETIGTVGGAVAGGAVGSAATGGSTIGTVGGAAVGGIIGNEVGERYDERNRRK
jgi:osmotically inducible lipoprotein OsmB